MGYLVTEKGYGMKTIASVVICLVLAVPVTFVFAEDKPADGASVKVAKVRLIKAEQAGNRKFELVEFDGKQYARLFFPAPKEDFGSIHKGAAENALRDFVIRLKKEPRATGVGSVSAGTIYNSPIHRAGDYLVLPLEGVTVR